MEIRQVTSPAERRAVCEEILRALPAWFGIEEALVDYVRKAGEQLLWAAYEAGRPVGFAALEVHTAYAAEVYVMGVLEDCHRKGVGRALVAALEACSRAGGMEFLTVKTLGEANPDAGYAKTRQFYAAMGFRPLEVFPTLWDAANPCLLMAKWLG